MILSDRIMGWRHAMAADVSLSSANRLVNSSEKENEVAVLPGPIS